MINEDVKKKLIVYVCGTRFVEVLNVITVLNVIKS